MGNLYFLQVKKMVHVGQEVIIIGGSHALHQHEKLAIAVSKAMRGHSLQETKKDGRFHVHTRTYLDGAILKEQGSTYRSVPVYQVYLGAGIVPDIERRHLVLPVASSLLPHVGTRQRGTRRRLVLRRNEVSPHLVRSAQRRLAQGDFGFDVFLLQEMERSADVLAAGLLEVSDPSLSSKFFIRQRITIYAQVDSALRKIRDTSEVSPRASL
ncbi:hypothetical protein BHE74_00034170 [Ensete ventricosum]|nr:hypothetical protein BHE74_00034170 [Ensete ventricosum]